LVNDWSTFSNLAKEKAPQISVYGAFRAYAMTPASLSRIAFSRMLDGYGMGIITRNDLVEPTPDL